jgi:hypothetical protein
MVQTAAAVVDDADTPVDEAKQARDATKDLLAAANEIGCPLSGTAACNPKNNPAACIR